MKIEDTIRRININKQSESWLYLDSNFFMKCSSAFITFTVAVEEESTIFGDKMS